MDHHPLSLPSFKLSIKEIKKRQKITDIKEEPETSI